MTKLKLNKIDNKIVVTICALLLLIIAFSSIASAATTVGHGTRQKLWTKGGFASVSNSEILTVNALVHYALNGVFGEACMANVQDNKNNITSINSLNNYCDMAVTFYKDAERYGEIVEARMKEANTQRNFWTGAIKGFTPRVDNAMNRFSALADEVIGLLIAFGLLTSRLVFTVIFMKLAWMPSHAIERRRIMMEIATAGTATMLLGNAWLVVSLFQAIFNRFWQTYAVYSKDWRTVGNMVLTEYKGFIVGLGGIATLLVLAMFVVNFVGLAIDGGAANKRSEKVQNLIHCSIAAAGLGSITLIVGFFWNIFS